MEYSSVTKMLRIQFACPTLARTGIISNVRNIPASTMGLGPQAQQSQRDCSPPVNSHGRQHNLHQDSCLQRAHRGIVPWIAPRRLTAEGPGGGAKLRQIESDQHVTPRVFPGQRSAVAEVGAEAAQQHDDGQLP